MKKEEVKTEVPTKLLSTASFMAVAANTNVWRDPNNTTELTKEIDKEEYDKLIDLCKFFYKTEPIVSTVINKLVEIGVNDIIVSRKDLPDNVFRFYQSLKPKILEFCEIMALELLLSGLVVPEIGYGPVDKEELKQLGVKKYNRLIGPVSMWVRDPKSISINSSMMSDTPSYFVEVPDEVVFFIKNKGKYSDGTEDKELYENLKTYYPDFVKKINAGEKKFLIDGRLVLRRKYTTDNPYPIPYISSSLLPLQHKRRMRRMDYSIMDKVISAIMHIKVGSDEFPVTNSEEDTEVFSDLRAQLAFRFQSDEKLERIFQLITNHTVDIKWVFPETTLLNEDKRYQDINEEILFGLGFPRVLITGEAMRTGTSDPEIAILSPVKTMESLRRKMLKVVKDIFKTVAEENGFKVPTVTFETLNLRSFAQFMESLEKGYNMSAVSRSSVSDFLGYDFEEEVTKLEEESTLLESKGLSMFGEQPFSRSPATSQSGAQQPQDGANKAQKTPVKSPKPE